MGANRHRAPTTLQLAKRIYRQQLEFMRDIETQLALIRLDLPALRRKDETILTLARTCRRLLAEKATLLAVVEANRFMSAALPRRPLPVLTEEVCK